MAILQSSAITGSLTVSGSQSNLVQLQGSGSTVFSVNGASGQLFGVSDDLTDSLFSVNTISGLPVIEAFADNTVKLGTFGNEELIVSGSQVSIVSASFSGPAVFSNGLSGNGSGLTNLNASNLSSGTVSDARLPGTISSDITGNAATATKLATARNIALTGAVTGNANFDGTGNISISTTATSDPTLTLAGDATGTATFTNLGNATLTVAVANDSHTHDGRYYTETESDNRFHINGAAYLVLNNTEASSITGGAYRIGLDANDSSPGASLGSYEGTDPMGIYVTGDNGSSTAITRIWHDGHFSGTNISNWQTAYNNHIVSLAGSGDGTLTLTQQDGGTISTNLAHTHSEYLTSNADDTASGTYTFTGKASFTQTATTIGGATVANASILIGNTTTGIGIDNNEIWSTGVLYIGTNSGNLELRPSGNVVDGSGNRFFNDAYHPNADAWTTGRTLTIGDTGKTVDGSGNVSWSRTELGITKTNIDALNINADLLDGQHGSYYTNAGNLTGTIPDVFSAGTRYNIGLIDGSSNQTRDKLRVWDSSLYTIGMKDGFSYGHLGGTGTDYAMSFQMNSDAERGFWWGDQDHTDAQGAMSLTTEGKLTVATSISVGQGETVTSPSTTPLYVEGSGSTVFDVQGSLGQLFSVTDNLTGTLFSVNDISGIPILSVDSDDTVTMGTFGENTLVVTGSNVGIGTASPVTKLDIVADSPQLRLRRVDGLDDDWRLYSWPSGLNIFPQTTSTVFFGRDGATTDVNVYNGDFIVDTDTLFVDASTDRVGIGTTTPGAKLEVIGGINAYSNGGANTFNFGRNSSEKVTFLVDDNNITFTADQDSDSDGGHGFILDRSFAGTGANYFDIRKGGSVQLRVDTSGNVGIGNTNPGNALHVGDGTADTTVKIAKADNNVSDHLIFKIGGTRIGEIGAQDTTWLRINQVTSKNIYTPRYIRADAGFFVDGTSLGINGSGRLLDGSFSGTYSNEITFSNRINIGGDIDVGAQVGTWITSDEMSDAIGWNNSYGVYIGSNVGGTHYLRGNGTFTTGGSTYDLWHEGNDGAGSGLDADLLDGQQGSYYLNYGNFTNTPTIGNATITIAAGGGLSTGGNFTTNQTGNSTITINHADTSTQGSVNNSNGTVIQDITLDGYGHITDLNSVNLDGRYYTESESDARYLQLSGGSLTGVLDFNNVSGRAITITADSYLGARDASIYLGNETSNYGWDLQYQGTGSGNNNKLRFVSTNSGTPKVAFEATQDGVVNLPQSGATVNGNIILTEADYDTYVCHLKTDQNTALAQGSANEFTVNFNIEEHNDTSYFSHSNGVVTVLEAGWYRIYANMVYDNASSSARNTIRAYVKKNGTEIVSTRTYDYDRGSSYGRFSNNKIETMLYLAVNDTVEIANYAYNEDGSVTIEAAESEFIVNSVAVSANTTNADTLDGEHGSYYRNASNINAGTISDARLPGSISSDITGNAATATKWATPRTLTIGDTGKSVDGSGDVSWSRSEIGITKTNIDALNIDADTVDGLQASQFLRSDATDSTSGNLTVGGDLFVNDYARIDALRVGTTSTDPGDGKLYVEGTITGNGDLYVDKLLRGGIGARTTSGTTDWNDSTNARSGQGYTLLLGTHSNGPGTGNYYHPFSFEYSSKNGAGNMTQFAIPYTGYGMYFRSRYSNTWSSWATMWNSGNDGAGSGLDADLLDGQQGSYYQNASNLNAGTISDARLPGSISSDITGNAATATKWATPRTLTIGDTGKSVDGSGDVSWSRTELGITKTNIDALNIDANTLDGIDSSAFLRSNANDTATGQIRLQNDLNYFGIATTNNEAEIVVNTGNAGSPQIGFTEHGDASWAIGVDDGDNSFKIHGTANSTIPTINNLATPLFEIATSAGIAYLNGQRIFNDAYHPNADKWTDARTITLGGDLSGNVSLDGSGNVTLTATVTSAAQSSFSVGQAATAQDAEFLDGEDSTYYLNYSNFTNTPTIGNASITLSAGTNLNGGGSFTTNQTGADTITFNLDSSPTLNSLNIDGIVLDESSNRAGLLEVNRDGTNSWSGFAIAHSGTSHWSLMGDQDNVGIYDDVNNEWVLLYNENSSLSLYHNGAVKLSTQSNGIDISGTINTGQGDTEVYLMNQNIRTTDAVTFSTVNTGQGANELYAMNQNVRSSDSVTFSSVTGLNAFIVDETTTNIALFEGYDSNNDGIQIGVNSGGDPYFAPIENNTKQFSQEFLWDTSADRWVIEDGLQVDSVLEVDPNGAYLYMNTDGNSRNLMRFDRSSSQNWELRLTNTGELELNDIGATRQFQMNCNVSVTGTLSKPGGSFKIKHPDPAKKETYNLYHSFVESPTAGDNIYRWQVEVVDGTAVVELPDYYKYLNENDQVWVSPFKHFGQAYGEVNEGQTHLTVTANADGLYNVLCIGTRKDEFAVESWTGCERLQLEEDL